MTDQAVNPPARPAGTGSAPARADRPADAPRAPAADAERPEPTEGPEHVPPAPGPGGGGAVGPSPGTAIARPLPEPLAHFAGRVRELAQLREDIARPGLAAAGRRAADRSRVLLVVGRPGVGRTAVAVRLAHDVAADYPDGRFFVRLTDDIGDPVPADRVARALLRELGAAPDVPEAAAALRAAAAGRRLLLVLDDVRRADQLAGLLPDGPGSLVVVTSHGPLTGVPDVRPCTLGGLDTPAALDLLAHAVGDIRVTNDPRGAEALVQELSGHPTALRLVGAHLAAQPRMSLSEAAARLRATPDTVPPSGRTPPAGGVDGPARGGGDGGGPAEERPAAPGELVRAFRLVYEALPGTAGRMLRCLVLAPAGCVDAQTASALAGCAVGAAADTLAAFADAALLVRGPAEGLYRVPGCLEPLLRGLLADTDRPEDVRLARARMLERTVRLLEACGTALTAGPPADGLPSTLRLSSPEEAAAWLGARRPALLAAARAAVADGQLDTLARRLIAALVLALLSLPGGEPATAERYELHTLVLGVATRRRLPRERAAALINLADLDAEAGRAERAVETYRQALAAARGAGDGAAEGRVLEALGGTYLDQQDLARASDWFGRALALRRARGELVDQARLHARIGAVLTYQGRYGPALREWRSAAGVHKRLGDLPSLARALAEAARVQEYAGHPEDALRSCRDALYWAREVRDRRLEAAVLLRLADAMDRLGDSGGAAIQRAAAGRLFRPGESPAF